MREIIFRGKKVCDGRWEMGCFIKSYDGKAYIGYLHESTSGDVDEVIPETVGQYTGLKDKNGVKIFEGDIVRFCEGKGVEFYVANKIGCKYNIYYDDDRHNCSLYHAVIDHGVEVIGNIHEKKEHEKLHTVKTRRCINCIKCGQDYRTSTTYRCYNEIFNVKTISDAHNQVCNCHRYVGEKE